ncbi:negative regulation of cellular response to hepatocyte growth factor stimulus [Homalodisca vitripennis]|nr:negative regulation of cellular response to hepatocyte growth factor stimulus [Homalodisca vitripennis]
MGLYSQQVDDFEVTVPQKITPGGRPLGEELSHHHERQRRLKRDAPLETLHYRLKVTGEDEILDLEPSSAFISPKLRVHRGVRTRKVSRDKTSCHYRGVVRNHRGSSVALSACNGLEHNVFATQILLVSCLSPLLSILRLLQLVTSDSTPPSRSDQSTSRVGQVPDRIISETCIVGEALPRNTPPSPFRMMWLLPPRQLVLVQVSTASSRISARPAVVVNERNRGGMFEKEIIYIGRYPSSGIKIYPR